uniref:Mitochondrial import inner membrane translocase subunit TIM22 n=1 Tax=Craspedostauros australis TaxID=1486917 RepID=A0A7R9ZSU2_9STRA|mmetsp:Transcript_8985/g.24303  ORF Transcript_8985/g.24303 Transcript_8985/m.24303 type:complete len:104 (+) Transcript_8985:1-312(+)
MNGRSFRWAKSWGSVSAVFGGSEAVVVMFRSPQQQDNDAWNSIFSSALAGAWFARKEGPQGMLKGAVTYGGLFFLISYLNTGGKRSNLLEYEEREVPATGNIK